MRINLTGVLEDGMPRRAGVPILPQKTIEIPQGGDVEIAVSVVTSSGNQVDLSGYGTDLLLTIKKRPQDDPPRVVKKASIASGVGTFLIEPGDTKYLSPGLYGYDIWLTKDSMRDAVVPLSPLLLQASMAAIPAMPPPPVLYLVEDDTEPLILDFNGTNISGWLIEVHLNYSPTPLIKAAVLSEPTAGIALVPWAPGDLRVGVWGGEVQITKPVSIVQTSDVFIANIRAEIA